MTEIERIIDQFDRAVNGNAWHGPSVTEIISDVDHTIASAAPMHGVHTIWEIMLHIIAWMQIGTKLVNGEQTPKDIPPIQDWPPVKDTGEASWIHAKNQLQEVHHGFAQRISQLTDADLLKNATGKNYTLYFLLHGIIQHNLYHAGQMAIIKSSLMKRT
jgi:uncharacterized damage-inducible protein DinB